MSGVPERRVMDGERPAKLPKIDYAAVKKEAEEEKAKEEAKDEVKDEIKAETKDEVKTVEDPDAARRTYQRYKDAFLQYEKEVEGEVSPILDDMVFDWKAKPTLAAAESRKMRTPSRTVSSEERRRDSPASEPLDDFTVTMANLAVQPIDYQALPQSIAAAMMFLQHCNPREMRPDHTIVGSRDLLPPQAEWFRGRRTVVFDLDQTLAHCSQSMIGDRQPEFRTLIDETTPPLDAHVYVRPHAMNLLHFLANFCEVVIFTASAPVYADKVLDFLDPAGIIFSGRLYRQHCTEIWGQYFKDMRRIGRKPENVILIDNSPLALSLTPEMGILCKSWFGDDWEDKELMHLQTTLRHSLQSPHMPEWAEYRYGLAAYLDRKRQAWRNMQAQQAGGAKVARGAVLRGQSASSSSPVTGMARGQ